MFPSPRGVWIATLISNDLDASSIVSVPSRGMDCDDVEIGGKGPWKSFRPLAGYGLRQSQVSPNVPLTRVSVPSRGMDCDLVEDEGNTSQNSVSVPSRGMDCDEIIEKNKSQGNSFRPLAGYGLRQVSWNLLFRRTQFPSPRGVWIATGMKNVSNIKCSSFRPLAGYGLRPQTDRRAGNCVWFPSPRGVWIATWILAGLHLV